MRPTKAGLWVYLWLDFVSAFKITVPETGVVGVSVDVEWVREAGDPPALLIEEWDFQTNDTPLIHVDACAASGSESITFPEEGQFVLTANVDTNVEETSDCDIAGLDTVPDDNPVKTIIIRPSTNTNQQLSTTTTAAPTPLSTPAPTTVEASPSMTTSSTFPTTDSPPDTSPAIPVLAGPGPSDSSGNAVNPLTSKTQASLTAGNPGVVATSAQGVSTGASSVVSSTTTSSGTTTVATNWSSVTDPTSDATSPLDTNTSVVTSLVTSLSTPSTSAPPSKHGGGSRSKQIAIIVLSVLSALFLLFVAIVVIIRRRRRARGVRVSLMRQIVERMWQGSPRQSRDRPLFDVMGERSRLSPVWPMQSVPSGRSV